jgi:hypothetical protein
MGTATIPFFGTVAAGDWQLSGLQVSGTGTFPLGDAFSLIGKLGIARTDLKLSGGGASVSATAPNLLLASAHNMTSPRVLLLAPNMRTWVPLEIPILPARPKLRCFPLALFSSFKHCCITKKAGLVPAFLLAAGAARMQVKMNNILGDEIMKKITAVLITIAALVAATTARAESTTLKTQTGNDIGLSLSSYQYQEPGIMSLKGVKIGLDLHTVKVLQNDQFIRGDLRYAFGTVDYNSNGTGSASGEPDWYIEARVLVGKDWLTNDAVFSPYTGLGYRYLFNDGRGITSTGAGGYRRESNYFYLPIGIIHRRALNDQARLVSTLEYDHLLAGKQISSLSDTGLGFNDVMNNQSSGYGLKLSIMYEQSKWAIGPYADYWNIGPSDIAPLYQNGILVGGGREPQNNTVEFGLKASQQF